MSKQSKREVVYDHVIIEDTSSVLGSIWQEATALLSDEAHVDGLWPDEGWEIRIRLVDEWPDGTPMPDYPIGHRVQIKRFKPRVPTPAERAAWEAEDKADPATDPVTLEAEMDAAKMAYYTEDWDVLAKRPAAATQDTQTQA